MDVGLLYFDLLGTGPRWVQEVAVVFDNPRSLQQAGDIQDYAQQGLLVHLPIAQVLGLNVFDKDLRETNPASSSMGGMNDNSVAGPEELCISNRPPRLLFFSS